MRQAARVAHESRHTVARAAPTPVWVRVWVRWCLAVVVAAALAAAYGQPALARQACNPKLRVRPGRVTFDLGSTRGSYQQLYPYPPAPTVAFPVYYPPSDPSVDALVELEVQDLDNCDNWEVWLQGVFAGDLGINSVWMAPASATDPAPGTVTPPPPWLAVLPQNQLLLPTVPGVSNISQAYKLRLRVQGTEAASSRATPLSVTLRFQLCTASGPTPCPP